MYVLRYTYRIAHHSLLIRNRGGIGVELYGIGVYTNPQLTENNSFIHTRYTTQADNPKITHLYYPIPEEPCEDSYNESQKLYELQGIAARTLARVWIP